MTLPPYDGGFTQGECHRGEERSVQKDYAGDHTLGFGSIHLAKMVGSSPVVKGRKPQSCTLASIQPLLSIALQGGQHQAESCAGTKDLSSPRLSVCASWPGEEGLSVCASWLLPWKETGRLGCKFVHPSRGYHSAPVEKFLLVAGRAEL